MTSAFVNPSWMPHSVGEAARAGDATADDLLSGRAWSHLLDGLRQASAVVLADDVPRNAADMAAGFRHLLVLLGIGLDNALREESGAVLAVKPSGVDAIYKWGMDCPDCIYTGAGLRGGETYRLWGNRGSARYVGLQSMAGMASSANVLLDELDLGPDGEVDLILSADSHEGNWLPIAENATALVIRHFFYDWDTEVASSLSIERIGAASGEGGAPGGGPAGGRGPAADRPGRLRRCQPRLLPAVLPARDAQHVPPSARRDRHGRSGGEPPGHRVLGARARRGARRRGLAPAGSLLELLAGEPLVGDHRLRVAPEQPQRAPGRGRRGRSPAHRDRPRGSRGRQLARHGGAQRRADHSALRPHGDGAGAHDTADQVLRHHALGAGGDPAGDTGGATGHAGGAAARREQAVLPVTPGTRHGRAEAEEVHRRGSRIR